MSRKQKIIVSITGIVIVIIALLGFTYAYYLTNIVGNPKDKSVGVSSAYLELVYGENSNKIVGSKNMDPGYSVTKYFTATNTGTKKVDYVVIMENVVNKLSRKQDLVYTLECTSYLKSGFSLASDGTPTGTENGTCDGVDIKQFPASSTKISIIGNDIDVTQVHYYKLIVTYNESDENQSIDMGRTFSAKINLIDIKKINPFADTDSLAYHMVNNAISSKNGTIFTSTPLSIPGVYTNGTVVTSEAKKTTWGTGIVRNGVVKPYQDYYWTYGTGYTIDEKKGIILTGISTCKYSECYADLQGKYLLNFDDAFVSSEANVPLVQKKFNSIFKITQAGFSASSNVGLDAYFFDETELSENVLSMTEDDLGTSYYYRGGVYDNYVDYAGLCWKIVRIEGDGSIKLMLASRFGVCETSTNITTTSGKIGSGDYGYIEDENGVTADFMNSENRETSMKYGLEAFLNGGTFDSNTYSGIDQSKIKLDTWCLGDKTNKYNPDTGETMTELDLSNQLTTLGYNQYLYKTSKRLSLDKDVSLKCNGEKWTSKVGTLSPDEIVYAGAIFGAVNVDNYLRKNFRAGMQTLAVNLNEQGKDVSLVFHIGTSTGLTDSAYVNDKVFIVPSITLISGIKITVGDGTINNPYVIDMR